MKNKPVTYRYQTVCGEVSIVDNKLVDGGLFNRMGRQGWELMSMQLFPQNASMTRNKDGEVEYVSERYRSVMVFKRSSLWKKTVSVDLLDAKQRKEWMSSCNVANIIEFLEYRGDKLIKKVTYPDATVKYFDMKDNRVYIPDETFFVSVPDKNADKEEAGSGEN